MIGEKRPQRNEPCWCGSGRKYKQCHSQMDDKREQHFGQGDMVLPRELLKNQKQIEGIRRSSKLNIAVLDYVAGHIRAGITTLEIDRWVAEQTRAMGGKPAPLDYEGFPNSVCTSVNEEVCHGIPSSTAVLKEGDIINVDVSTLYQGYFSDSSRMFCIGAVDQEWEKLVRVGRECVEKGLDQVRPWGYLGDIGAAVSEHARANGYQVVHEIGGHGIGLEFHEDPFVSYVGSRGTDFLLVPGMVFTIEPMINMGSRNIVIDEENGWTVRTADGLPSVQWEITVAVTEKGYEVLTW